ncbi:hypothetical protein B0A52_04377 [Exophiala mesophila]|uniref:Uncharacterized protein n=1 Tax=Exophiala mesophila TaxID=212818 RepID=A0A438N8R9_EXOME|nr:hypothetical protein B0A52_04377 [Exophiala mesophila]
MTYHRLGQVLGTTSPQVWRRHHKEDLIDKLVHRNDVSFSISQTKPDTTVDEPLLTSSCQVAHQAGVNCLTVDNIDGQFLITGGADSIIRLWNLDNHTSSPSSTSPSGQPWAPNTHYPIASSSRATPESHTHALTSISIYPFDPTPSTLLSTAYDKTLKVTSITPTSLVAIHTFPLDYAPYTHAVSTVPDSSPLIAVGTAHPAVRLLDLRSGLSTHSLSGPNGAIYSLAWSPTHSHLLASGSADGKTLFFDIRRANPAFASLDHDDAIGVVGEPPSTGALSARHHVLDFQAVAHNGPVTSVQWNPTGDKIVTAGHDQRIRVWDAATGRNDLVHFGPRVRNDRAGQLQPLISPGGSYSPGREMLFWPNDDGRGMIFQHLLREGNMVRILRTQGIKIAQVQSEKSGSRSSRGSAAGVSRLTSKGRINAMAWRVNAMNGYGIEMYTAHGDGSIGAWFPRSYSEEKEDDNGNDESIETYGTHGGQPQPAVQSNDTAQDQEEIRRKRKRALIGDLVEGLAKKPMSLS